MASAPTLTELLAEAKKDIPCETTEPKQFYKCSMCSKTIIPHAVYLHYYLPFSDEEIHCPVCDVNITDFNSEEEIFQHFEQYVKVKAKKNKTKKFGCSICDKTSSKKENVVKHFFAHIERKHFKCTICDLEFNNDNKFVEHMAIHYMLQFYLCESCKKSLKDGIEVCDPITKRKFKTNFMSDVNTGVAIIEKLLKQHEEEQKKEDKNKSESACATSDNPIKVDQDKKEDDGTDE